MASKITLPTIVRPSAAQVAEVISQSLVPHKDRRADLLWGKSKMGKGINAWMGIIWMLKTYGKKFLWFTAEPGSMPKIVEDYIQAGLGDSFAIVNQPKLLSILSTVLEGGKWPVYMKKGDTIIRSFRSKEAECDPSQYGLIVVDSLTSIGDEIMRWFARPENKAVLPMSPKEENFNILDPGTEGMAEVHIHGNAPTHILEAVKFLQRLVVGSANLPYQKVLWIARETRGSRGEKSDKQGNIVVAGEPMYGPELPGRFAIPRVTSWFGGAYHCDAVPKGGAQDDRPTVADGNALLAAQQKKLSLIPDWEYRIYLRPHPDPRTGLLYDAGNRMPPHLKVPPFYVCTAEEIAPGEFKTEGLNTIWELERTQGAGTVDALQERFSNVLNRFGGGKTQVGNEHANQPETQPSK